MCRNCHNMVRLRLRSSVDKRIKKIQPVEYGFDFMAKASSARRLLRGFPLKKTTASTGRRLAKDPLKNPATDMYRG
jgi:hypothetical protein